MDSSDAPPDRQTTEQFATVPLAMLAPYLRKVSQAAAFAWIVLKAHAAAKDDCFPKVERIARLTGYSERHTQEALAELESAKLIQRTMRAGRATLYRVIEPQAADDIANPQLEGVRNLAPRGAESRAPGVRNLAPINHQLKKKVKGQSKTDRMIDHGTDREGGQKPPPTAPEAPDIDRHKFAGALHDIRKRLPPADASAPLVLQVAALVAQGRITEKAATDAAEAVAQKKPSNPVGYFRQVLNTNSLGGKLAQLLGQAPPPESLRPLIPSESAPSRARLTLTTVPP